MLNISYNSYSHIACIQMSHLKVLSPRLKWDIGVLLGRLSSLLGLKVQAGMLRWNAEFTFGVLHSFEVPHVQGRSIPKCSKVFLGVPFCLGINRFTEFHLFACLPNALRGSFGSLPEHKMMQNVNVDILAPVVPMRRFIRQLHSPKMGRTSCHTDSCLFIFVLAVCHKLCTLMSLVLLVLFSREGIVL